MVSSCQGSVKADGGRQREVPWCGSRAGSGPTHLGKAAGPKEQLRVQSTGTSMKKVESGLCPGSWDQDQTPHGALGTATAGMAMGTGSEGMTRTSAELWLTQG